MTSWRIPYIGYEKDDIEIGGISVWRQKWRPVNEAPVKLPHPDYPTQIHDFRVYEIGDPSCPVRFAAAKLSAGVRGFYVPEKPN